MDKIEALGAMIHMSHEEEYSVGQLGATVKVPHGHPDKGRAFTEARLNEIERRILEIEATLGSAPAAEKP